MIYTLENMVNYCNSKEINDCECVYAVFNDLNAVYAIFKYIECSDNVSFLVGILKNDFTYVSIKCFDSFEEAKALINMMGYSWYKVVIDKVS